jgi:hypothetical protein
MLSRLAGLMSLKASAKAHHVTGEAIHPAGTPPLSAGRSSAVVNI